MFSVHMVQVIDEALFFTFNLTIGYPFGMEKLILSLLFRYILRQTISCLSNRIC